MLHYGILFPLHLANFVIDGGMCRHPPDRTYTCNICAYELPKALLKHSMVVEGRGVLFGYSFEVREFTIELSSMPSVF
jgi:hypothetical protein